MSSAHGFKKHEGRAWPAGMRVEWAQIKGAYHVGLLHRLAGFPDRTICGVSLLVAHNTGPEMTLRFVESPAITDRLCSQCFTRLAGR